MLQLPKLTGRGSCQERVTLTERLPYFIEGSCELNISFFVEAKDEYFLLHLQSAGDLNVICQRCMEVFSCPYTNSLIIAVCENDKKAEELLSDYECIVSPNFKVDLNELITDELHLYAPHAHLDEKECYN